MGISRCAMADHDYGATYGVSAHVQAREDDFQALCANFEQDSAQTRARPQDATWTNPHEEIPAHAPAESFHHSTLAPYDGGDNPGQFNQMCESFEASSASMTPHVIQAVPGRHPEVHHPEWRYFYNTRFPRDTGSILSPPPAPVQEVKPEVVMPYQDTWVWQQAQNSKSRARERDAHARNVLTALKRQGAAWEKRQAERAERERLYAMDQAAYQAAHQAPAAMP